MNDRVKAATKLRDLSYNERELLNAPNHLSTGDDNVVYHIIDALGLFEDNSRVKSPTAVRILADFIDPACYLEYREWTPSGGDECDLEWDWRCSNCDFDLTERYSDLDIATPEELGLTYCPHCGARIIGTRYGKDNKSER